MKMVQKQEVDPREVEEGGWVRYLPRHIIQEMAERRIHQSESQLNFPGPVCAHPQRWCRGRGFPKPQRSLPALHRGVEIDRALGSEWGWCRYP